MLDLEQYNNFIGDRITQLRMEKGISAREMSFAVSTNPSYISRVERHERFPSYNIFLLICDYFNITPEEFFSTNKKHAGEETAKQDAACTITFSNLTQDEFEYVTNILNKIGPKLK